MDNIAEEPTHQDIDLRVHVFSQRGIYSAQQKRAEYSNRALAENGDPNKLKLTKEQCRQGIIINEGMNRIFRKFGVSVGQFNEDQIVLGYVRWIGSAGFCDYDGVIQIAVDSDFAEEYAHEKVHDAGLRAVQDNVPVKMGEVYSQKSKEWSLLWFKEAITEVTTRQVLIESGLVQQSQLINKDPGSVNRISFSIGSGYMTETRMLGSLIMCLTDYCAKGGARDVIDTARRAGIIDKEITENGVTEEDILAILQSGYFSAEYYSLPFKLMASAFREQGGIKKFVELSRKFEEPIRRENRIWDQESIAAERQLYDFLSAVNQQR
ncbi:MAG TPA: hypothetical protein VMW41_06105 [Candidatus Bathyarchaeia archaeon]|nr:hypothetical protein [Candidatus Bathyarchaeia archaeon]